MGNNEQEQQSPENNQAEAAESNAERDQDHGKMNNGTIGGSMGTIGGSNEQDSDDEYSKKANKDLTGTVPGDTSGGTGNG